MASLGNVVKTARCSGPTRLGPDSHACTNASASSHSRHPQKRKAELLEQLGGVVHGGYQIDMFGVKRGRCSKNTKCFRFAPVNMRTNGCAMKGTGAITCSRCAHQNLDHEDLGRWVEGEPQLIDERGDRWKFETTFEGVRAVRMDR